ncbi:MAG: hypothetical protein RL634_564 [Bacteroidota bacterium]|jgi:AraC-like DNA-binding protein
MATVTKLDSVIQYNQLRGVKTLHPLISLVDLSTAKPMPATTFHFGVYAIYLKELKCGELKYGRGKYDYQEGTLVFVAPGQILGVQPGVKTYEPKGWALLFDPEFIRSTALGKAINKYSFFSYDVNEALHISDNERKVVMECFLKIQSELNAGIDKHTKTLICTNITLLLDYCTRFYDRQFITRDHINRGLLEQFENLLNKYLSTDQPQHEGLPSVAYFAKQLHLSPNYFGDMIRKEAGVSALEYIQTKVIAIAKQKLVSENKSISEVAFELGFKYPQHFTRLFKQKVGITPNLYKVSDFN